MIEELEKEFIGGGEVKGFKFKQLHKSDRAYVYEVDVEGKIHYEVFYRKTTNKFDFETKTVLEDEKEYYPKSNSFGVWAWTFPTLLKVMDKFSEINNRVVLN